MKSRYLNDIEEKAILLMYNEGYNTVDIANTINRSSSTIQRFLKKQGFNIKPKKISITIGEEQIICNAYQNGKTTEEIAKQFYPKIKSGNTISAILKKNNISIRQGGHLKILKREDFFDKIDNEEKAYVLGLIISDGCVILQKSKHNVWSITLHQKDSYLLEKIRNIIGIGRKIVYSRNEAILSVSSNHMVKSLSEYGIVPRKSLKTYLPEIDPLLMPHLIRGIFDGDGTVYNTKYSLIFGFYGSALIIRQIKAFLVQELCFPNNKIIDKQTISFVTFGARENVKSFYNYIYKNCNICLKRKRVKFEEFLKEKNINS